MRKKKIKHRPATGSSIRCSRCGLKITDLIAAKLDAGKPVHNTCTSMNRLLHARRTKQYEPINRQRVFERDCWRCGICKKRIRKQLKHPHPMSAVVDHIVPIKLGGAHTYVNVQAAHWNCNASKGWTAYGCQLALIG